MALVAVCLLTGFAAPLHAQFDDPFGGPFFPSISPTPSAPAAAAAEPPPGAVEGEFPDGASLKVDPELERLLQRAEQFANTGRFDLAAVLWQKVLDSSGETVLSQPDWIDRTSQHSYRRYASFSGEIQTRLAQLPADALKAYRLTADGEAKAALAAAASGGEEQALDEVVRRFFLSTHGDEAAFRLAALKLDRHDFVGASRLLTRLLMQYPRSSVPRSEILLRLALAEGRLGNLKSARSLLSQINPAALSVERRVALAAVSDDLQHAEQPPTFAQPSEASWQMTLGGAAHNGHMPRLPAAATRASLSELWSSTFPVKLEVLIVPDRARGFFNVRDSGDSDDTKTSDDRVQLIQRWKDRGWLLAGQLRFSGRRVYFKTGERLVCVSATSGEVLWRGRRNAYRPDPLTRMIAQIAAQGVALPSDVPRSASEVMIFADRIHQSMTIAGDLVLSVEGKLLDGEAASAEEDSESIQWGVVPRRGRQNWLAAYEAVTGKLRWYRSAHDGEATEKYEIGFMAAPTPADDNLLVPVSDNGALWLYALDAEDGRTVWKTYLCDEPTGGCSPWSPIDVAVEGGDAYVATGAGVVFAVDAHRGGIRWAVRYQRSSKSGSAQLAQYGFAGVRQPNGWQQDYAVVYGKQVVVMPSDSDRLFALDRRTGTFLWDSPQNASGQSSPADYCLGVVGPHLYVAGKNTVCCYNIPAGSLRWTHSIDDSQGRGALTSDSIYLPVKDSVLRLDAVTGKELTQVGMVSSKREPLGSLYSDGQRLLAVGMGRVYALTDLAHRLDTLAVAIRDGDGRAQLERMWLLARSKKLPEAIADLQGAYASLKREEGSRVSREALLNAINELGLERSHPQATLKLLAEAGAIPPEDAPATDLPRRQSEALHAVLAAIESQPLPGVAADILAIAPLCDKPHVRIAATRAMAASATPEDAEVIQRALSQRAPVVRLVALGGAEAALGKDAPGVLAGLLKDADDSVRLGAAIVLANSEDRQALPALVGLLDSPELTIRDRSFQALRALTGKTFDYAASKSANDRAASIIQWELWLEEKSASAELRLPIREPEPLLGRTLICYYQKSKVLELDSSGKMVWQADFPKPWGCHGLPNGHRLVASYSQQRIVEFDADGKEVWSKDELPGRAFCVRRLDNGNTLVGCYDTGKILEIRPDRRGTIAWEVSLRGNPMDVRRLPGGNTLVCLLGRGSVVEIDAEGKVVWEVKKMGGPRSAQRLPGGNTLVVQTSAGQVVEVDPQGSVVWKHAGLSNPLDAQRLPDGNTLIVDSNGLHEVDPAGKIVWQRKGSGASRVWRY